MKLAAGFAAGLIAAGAAVAGAFGVAADPELAQAAALRHAGRATEAVPWLQALAAERPEDADVQLQLGLALEAAGRPAEARQALLACLRLAPDYRDAQLALARLARGEARPDRWRIDLSGAYSHLTRGLDPWRATSLAVSRTGAPGTVTAKLEETRRFGRGDVYGELLGARPLRGAEFYGAIGGTPRADHRPKLAVRAGAVSPPRALGGSGLSARVAVDAEWARYPSGEVKSVHPALIVTQGERLSLEVRSYNVVDERRKHRTGWGVQGSVAATPRLTLRAGYADAPESSEGRTVEVKATHVGAGWALDERTSLRLDSVREDRSAYDRHEISLSLARRF